MRSVVDVSALHCVLLRGELDGLGLSGRRDVLCLQNKLGRRKQVVVVGG